MTNPGGILSMSILTGWQSVRRTLALCPFPVVRKLVVQSPVRTPRLITSIIICLHVNHPLLSFFIFYHNGVTKGNSEKTWTHLYRSLKGQIFRPNFNNGTARWATVYQYYYRLTYSQNQLKFHPVDHAFWKKNHRKSRRFISCRED